MHNVDSAETVNIRDAGCAFSASGYHGKRMGNFTENIVNVRILCYNVKFDCTVKLYI